MDTQEENNEETRIDSVNDFEVPNEQGDKASAGTGAGQDFGVEYKYVPIRTFPTGK